MKHGEGSQVPLSWQQIHLAAIRESMRAHRDLGIDTSRRIDPFSALERSGVVIMRQRLDNLAGLYLPGDVAEARPDGVLINSAHPLSKQRFTAAHELAHHRRDRELIVDTDTEWLGRADVGKADRERIAEAFAAWFLMPKSLIESSLARLGFTTSQLDSSGAYALALEFGTSYEATVRHLFDARFIGRALRDRLLPVKPQVIKQALGASDVPADSWKDIWLVRSSGNASRVYPVEGDALVLALSEIPSSGYIWQTAEVPPWLQLVKDEYYRANEELVGGEGERRLVFRVDGHGRQQIRLVMGRPWQPNAVEETFNIEIVAQPKPENGIIQSELLAAAGL